MNIQIFYSLADNRLRPLKPETREGNFALTFFAFTGAFLFSVILIVLVHEIGHFLAFKMRGYEAVSIRINPFMGTTSCQQNVRAEDFLYITLGGTVFNLSIATISAIALHFTKNPNWIFVKMYSAMAFLIEGMVIIAGLFFQETITDFAWLIKLGWSPILVGFLGTLFIVIGGYLSYEVWISLGITQEHSWKQLILINIPFLVYGLFGFVIGLAILPIEISFFRKFLAICMVLHWSYLGLRIMLAPMLMPRMQKRIDLDIPKVTIGLSGFSLFLGCASWVLSFLVLN
jgi:hypothetical protein